MATTTPLTLEYDTVTRCLDSCVPCTNVTFGVNMSNCCPVTSRSHGNLISLIIVNTLYAIICVVGLVGNGLVIYVVIQYTKMKTVTNMYILNLAVSDLCFLVGLPFLITTAIMKGWIFGFVMCKIYLILTSINWFTSVFTLTVMSADRYMAVCHAVRSMSYRTPVVSAAICVCVWTASFLVMLPIILYSTTVPKQNDPGGESCTLMFPQGQPINSQKAFIWYTFLMGMAIPVTLIIVFYGMVLVRLKNVGPRKKSKEKKKSHKKVTKMVFAVIAVYIICWLPYWVFQLVQYYQPSPGGIQPWKIYLFQVLTCMSYANSTLNPLIYAFLSDNFRKAFIKAFRCVKPSEVNGTLQMEHSVCPAGRHQPATTTLLQAETTAETEIASANTIRSKIDTSDSSSANIIVAKTLSDEDIDETAPASV